MHRTLLSASAHILVFLSLIGLAAVSHAATVGFKLSGASELLDSVPYRVELGEEISLTLAGHGFTKQLIGGGVTLEYDPAILEVIDVAVDGSKWDFAPGTHSGLRSRGRVEDTVFTTLWGSYTGTVDLATVFSFKAVGFGTTSLNLVTSTKNPFSSALGEVIDVDFASANIQVVPVPAAFWLLAGAGTSLMLLARRRRGGS